jgi:transaldolase
MAANDRQGDRNPLLQLRDAGQSVWLDFIDRPIMRSGKLARLIREDGLAGMTSNPTIFDKAIATSDDYDAEIAEMAARGRSTGEIYEALVVADIQAAADALRTVYDQTGGGDGFVSVEVSPRLAGDTAGTIREVRRWMSLVGRPNLMVKIPATAEGVPAIEEMISEGRNINITLIFSLEMYRRVIEAYLRGTERRVASGGRVDGVASVASFFVSRIDTEADQRLEARAKAAAPEDTARIRALQGKTAIANAKLAYAMFRETFAGPRFAALSTRGARLQRPLWASTSTKNPAYPDLLYAEALVGPDTVDTLPPATVDAFRDHGRVSPRAVMEGVDEARDDLRRLEAAGVSLDAVTHDLLEKGVRAFTESFDELLASIDKKRAGAAGARR